MAKTPSLLKLGAGFVAAIALLANCSPGEQTQEQTQEQNQEQTREERVAEAMKEFDAVLAKANETNGPGVPAMWTLADEDTTIHIFGTVHILKPEIEWRTAAFDEAFDNAGKLVFELDLHSPEGMQAIGREMIGAAMFEDGKKLSDVLSESDLEIVKTAAAELGVPMASLQPTEPWMAALNLANVQWMKDGFDPSSGVEQVLVADALAQEKSFGFLETAELQAAVFDNLEMETQIDMLVEGALTLDVSGSMLDTLTAEWADGDVAGLGTIAANPDAPGSREFYDALFLNRNAAWVPQIEEMLDEPGTIMIAVGAGHLAGPDSVITMLETKGHSVTRVQ